MKKLAFLLFVTTFFNISLLNAQCTANAGADVYTCPPSYLVPLNGSGFTASGSMTFQWFTSGNGTFIPNAQTLNATYSLSAAEIAGGGVTLFLTITDPNTSCTATDTMQIFWGVCSPAGLVTGKVFNDLNANGIQDAGENGIPNKFIYIDYNLVYSYGFYGAFTDINGYYELKLPNGTTQISTYLDPNWSYTYPTGPYYHDVTISNDTVNDKNFGMTQAPNVKEVSINLYSSVVVPGFPFYSYINYKNNGSEILNGTVEFKYDPNLLFQNSNPAENLHNIPARTLTYNYINLLPGEERYINLYFDIPAAVPLGTQIVNSTMVSPVGGDVYASDNFDTTKAVAVGSFDPNDKQVEPIGIGTENYINSDDDLKYTIRFQNTGTASAIKVVVADTIDTDLNLTTFRMIASSHNYVLSVDTNRVLRWTFDNIMLPDSNANEPESHGFISFEIGQQSNNANGTQIKNSAAIYFDYNYPVVTNQTLNTVGDNILLGIKQQNYFDHENIKVFPNPASDIFYIDAETKILSYQIISTNGNILREGNYLNSIDISMIHEGIYFLKINSENLVSYRKLVIK
jgi:uncharacterized repeat protein (TIGR01451 family)